MPQPPNLQKMLAEAQAMLAAQQEAQEKLKEQKVEASSGGGMVKVAMTGDMRLESLTIDPDAVDPEDVEMLQDMVVGRDQRGAADGRGAPAEPARRRRAGRLRPDERARVARPRRDGRHGRRRRRRAGRRPRPPGQPRRPPRQKRK